MLSYIFLLIESTAFNENAIECDDNEIEEISDEDDYEEEPKRTIKDRKAVEIFNNALKWAESEMFKQRYLNILLRFYPFKNMCS